MSIFQQRKKLEDIRRKKKYHLYTEGEKQPTEAASESNQILNLIDEDFKIVEEHKTGDI